MPDFFSHMFLGEAALPNMPAAMQEAASLYPSLFTLGCQGPDLYFYYKLLRPRKRRRAVTFADQCHDQHTRELLGCGALFLLKHREDTAFMAYWTGFLCHYVLDRCAHPYINEHTSGFRAHKRLEMHLDAYMLHRKWASASYRVSIPRLIELPGGIPDKVSAFWVGLAKEIYQYELDPAVVEGSYKGMRRITGLYYSPHPYFRPVKQYLGNLFGLDIGPYLSEFTDQAPLLPESGYDRFESCFAEAYALAGPLGRRYGALLDGTCSLNEMVKGLPDINFSGKRPGEKDEQSANFLTQS